MNNNLKKIPLKDYQVLLGISSVLTNVELNEISQLQIIKELMYNWSLNLKNLVNEKNKKLNQKK